MRLTAKARRVGGWWAVEVPEVPDLFTQARRLEQIPAMVEDAAALLEIEEVEVSVVPKLPDAVQVEIAEVRRLANAAAAAQQAAAAKSRGLVDHLREEGLSVRDVATVLEISPQRVSQLAPGHRRAQLRRDHVA
jgi:predicted RNase H-like HicB family nuclease